MDNTQEHSHAAAPASGRTGTRSELASTNGKIVIHPIRRWTSFRYYLTDIYKGNRVTMLEVHEHGDDERRQPTRRISTTAQENAPILQRLCDALNAFNDFAANHHRPYLDIPGELDHEIDKQQRSLAADVKSAKDEIDSHNELARHGNDAKEVE